MDGFVFQVSQDGEDQTDDKVSTDYGDLQLANVELGDEDQQPVSEVPDSCRRDRQPEADFWELREHAEQHMAVNHKQTAG